MYQLTLYIFLLTKNIVEKHFAITSRLIRRDICKPRYRIWLKFSPEPLQDPKQSSYQLKNQVLVTVTTKGGREVSQTFIINLCQVHCFPGVDIFRPIDLDDELHRTVEVIVQVKSLVVHYYVLLIRILPYSLVCKCTFGRVYHFLCADRSHPQGK